MPLTSSLEGSGQGLKSCIPFLLHRKRSEEGFREGGTGSDAEVNHAHFHHLPGSCALSLVLCVLRDGGGELRAAAVELMLHSHIIWG